MVEGKMW